MKIPHYDIVEFIIGYLSDECYLCFEPKEEQRLIRDLSGLLKIYEQMFLAENMTKISKVLMSYLSRYSSDLLKEEELQEIMLLLNIHLSLFSIKYTLRPKPSDDFPTISLSQSLLEELTELDKSEGSIVTSILTPPAKKGKAHDLLSGWLLNALSKKIVRPSSKSAKSVAIHWDMLIKLVLFYQKAVSRFTFCDDRPFDVIAQSSDQEAVYRRIKRFQKYCRENSLSEFIALKQKHSHLF